MLVVNPPDHTRLRRVIQPAFAPAAIKALAPAVQAITDRLLDDFATPGTHDLMDELAFALPIAVIAELIGVPPEDRKVFAQWSHIVLAGPARPGELPAAQTGLVSYIRGLLAAKREHADGGLIGMLLAPDEQGDRLTENEMISTVYLLLLAGHDTTAGLIGNGAYLAAGTR